MLNRVMNNERVEKVRWTKQCTSERIDVDVILYNQSAPKTLFKALGYEKVLNPSRDEVA